jgi:hypothetical protein
VARKRKKAKGKSKRKTKEKARRGRAEAPGSRPRCGLCGKTGRLTKTECCGNWICDDEDKYVLFSFARNSCHRNHRRFTLCGHHYDEGHSGRWQNCKECREAFEAEMYAYYGTNEYNFEKLPDPPKYEPTRCSKCGRVIVLSEGGYVSSARGYECMKCSGLDLRMFV